MGKNMEMKQKGYLEQGLDLKRLILVLGRKLWLIVVGAIVGAILGGVTYKIVTNIIDGEPEYQANADYYITFNFDEFNYGADYYNAYTWDGILRDDPIVDYALTLLPEDITKDTVKAAVSGEMLGDYRILTVHVKADTKEKADMIAAAYKESLWNFGQEIELLDSVELWSQEEAVLFEKNNKTGNAAFLGTLIVTLLVIFALLFYYVLEDACYVEKDAEERFGLPVYGMLTKKQNVEQQMLNDNLSFAFGSAEVENWNGESVPTKEECARLREVSNILINIPWGRNNGRQVERVLRQMKLQGCDVKGIVITEAEDAFVKAYYMVGSKRDKKKDKCFI